MEIIKAQIEHMDIVRDLFREYQAWLDAACCFQGFEEELANLPGSYAPPKGTIYLAFDDEHAVACAAIRQRSDKPETDAELKRLYVKEAYRGQGLGRDIFYASMSEAQKIGYENVVLETLPAKMKTAQILYRDFGFRPISNYSDNTDEDVEYFRYCFKDNDK